MGCGASSSSAAPPETVANRAPAQWFGNVLPLTEADAAQCKSLQPRITLDYCGMRSCFYSIPVESASVRRAEASDLVEVRTHAISGAMLDKVLAEAHAKFRALDTGNPPLGVGALSPETLEPLCEWLFEQFTGEGSGTVVEFGSPEERVDAVERQQRRFHRNTPGPGVWTWRQLEDYVRRILDEAESLQLARATAFARAYDKVAAARQFAGFDTNGNQYLEGEELHNFAAWLCSAFAADGEEGKAEAIRIERLLHEASGRFHIHEVEHQHIACATLTVFLVRN